MKTIYERNGITVTEHNFGWPIGRFYRVTDGTASFSMDECPPLHEASLRALIISYKHDRYQEMTAEAMETHHCVEN